jgi:hypothetical protein
MDSFTLLLAILTTVSELLPLFGDGARYNGILHGVKTIFLHVHAGSDCHLDVQTSGVEAEIVRPKESV